MYSRAGGSQSDGLERVTTAGKVQRFYVRQTRTGAVHGLLSTSDGSLLLTEHGGPAAVVRLDVPALGRTHEFTSGKSESHRGARGHAECCAAGSAVVSNGVSNEARIADG